ncbi:uncharacterized protein [Amphiura filiformis]|uniref:uncharacterized protein n=1 Tax=Amphiura filiformis TaxID=82378 RepID=UPI003B21F5F2
MDCMWVIVLFSLINGPITTSQVSSSGGSDSTTTSPPEATLAIPAAESSCDTVCLHGVCVSNGTDTRCICPDVAKWTGEFCDRNISRMTHHMGMQSGDILDSQISASNLSSKVTIGDSRLRVGSGWIPGIDDTNPMWLRVDFAETMDVMGFITEGMFESLSISFEELQMADTLIEIFSDPEPEAEYERRLVVVFDEPLVTKFISIYPTTTGKQTNFTMEILGYNPPILCVTNICHNGGVCLRSGLQTRCICPVPGWDGEFCENDMRNKTQPLGMQSGVIRDSQLSASSSSSSVTTATESRIGVGSGWIPALDDSNPWIKVNLMKVTNVTGLVVSGNFSSFSVAYYGSENLMNSTDSCFFIDPDPDHVNYRRLVAAVDEPMTTPYIEIRPLPGSVVNMTFDILGYTLPSPVGIRCLSNCRDLVTPSLSLGLRTVFNKSHIFGDMTKTYEWILDRMDLETSEYVRVEMLSRMAATGVNRDAIGLKENVLESGSSYRLRVKVHIDGGTDIDGDTYMVEQQFIFGTNTPPSLGHIDISPTYGFAALTTFTSLCQSSSYLQSEESDLTYQYSTRYREQGVGFERQLTETDSCHEIPLDLPVGNNADNYTLEVVVRVTDSYGGFAEGIYPVQVKLPLPLLTNASVLLDYLESSESDSVSDNLQTLNVLLSIVNAISYTSQMAETGNNTGNTTDGTSGTGLGSSLEKRVQLRSALIALLNVFAQRVNSTIDAKLVLTGMQYATAVEEELTFRSLVSLIPSLEIAIDILYENGDGNTGSESGDGTGSGTGSDSGSNNNNNDDDDDDDGSGNQTELDGSAQTASRNVTIHNRDFSFGVLSLLHIVNVAIVDVDKKQTCDESATPKEAPALAPNVNGTAEIKLTAEQYNEIFEYLESLVIGNILMTLWPGEPPQSHRTAFALITVYRTSGSDRQHSTLQAGNSGFIADDVRIPNIFLSSANSDNVMGTSIVSRNRNPYPQSCSYSSCQSIEARDENGRVISIKDADVNIDVGFQRTQILKAEESKKGFPSDIDMMIISFKLTKPGASAVVILLNSEEQDGSCIWVFSRKTSSPSMTRHHEKKMFMADGTAHEVTFTDLPMGDRTNPPTHYLGIKVVKCWISNITNELEMTSTAVVEDQDPLNVTFETYVHSCMFRDISTKQWDGKGCKVNPASTLTNTKCICNHMTSFASSFYVPVNKIDFAYVFANANLAENHTVFTAIICLLAFYVLMLIWLRKKDKDDMLKWSAHPLVDNTHGKGYFYTVSVHTGFATNAGTRSTVRFDMVGKRGSTGQRLLCDTDGFLHHDDGSLNHYVLKLPRSIGELESLLIWHDNTGEAAFASWYLDWVLISDLQTGEKWAFICGDWLATNKGEGKIFRSLKPASEGDAAKIQGDFFRILRGTFADDNLWVSLFTRPTPSSFSRVQRLSVCLTFLFLFMITNAMFYRTDDEQEELPEGGSVRLGPFEIDFQQVYIGTISILIIMPVNFILVALFKSVQMSYEGHEELAVITKDTLKGNFKRHCRAPPIMKYVAWTLVFLSIVLSAFFVVLYSLMWGHEKSKSWLMSMLTSFLESLLVFEPVKAFGAALIILMIIKCKKKANFHEPEAVVYQDELDASSGAGLAVKSNIKDSNNKVEEHLEEWEKKTATASLFRQIVSHITFVIITIIIILQHRSVDSFYMTETVQGVFQGAEEEFTEIRNTEGFWEWTNDILLPAVFPSDTLPVIDEERLVEKGTMFLTGPVRFRQLRLQHDESCKHMNVATMLSVHCKPPYAFKVEEKAEFGTGWMDWTNKTCSKSDESYCPWSYYSAATLVNPTFFGKTGTTYAGGGYIAQWDFTQENAESQLQILKDNNWLDEYTIAVFVEFTVYNANVNLFSYVSYVLEFSAVGNIEPYPVVQTFRLYAYTSAEDIAAITTTLTFVLFVLSLLYFVIREIDDMKRSGKKYLFSVSNWLELCIIISSITVLLAYMIRKVSADSTSLALQDAQEEGDYVNFHPIAVMDEVFSVILGLAGFLSTLKVNILLSFDKRFTQFKRTMTYASLDLMAFGIYFFIFLFAFVAVNALVLGSEVEDYSTVLKTTETLLVLLLGQFRVHRYSGSMAIFSQTFFIIYCVVIGFILCRIFVAIVCDAFTETQKEDAAAMDGVRLEKVIGSELKRQFRELFPCRGILHNRKRSDAYKFKSTEKLGSVHIDIPEVKVAWGADFDAMPLPSRSPPPAYHGVHDPPLQQQLDYLEDLREWTPSPDPKSVDLMFTRAMESLEKMEKTVERI